MEAKQKKRESTQILSRLREIPYNYTSYTDREIVIRILGQKNWNNLNQLRKSRKTGISAKMLFEILGDIWIIQRNPFIQDDLLQNEKRWKALTDALHHRLDQILIRAADNKQAIEIFGSVREAINAFEEWFSQTKELRIRALKALKKVTHKDNIAFDGLVRVSHATDASDWRVELPFVVITPDTSEEVIDIVNCCIKLGLTIIPRGGGTGYTGSCVPLYEKSAIINTEKLEKTGEIKITDTSPFGPYATLEVEAGVVTKRVADIAEMNGFVFAVDPTSQTASTIGGNIAMNAGGKKAVLWGTTIDNLLSWKLVNPSGEWLVVERLNHNHGKIHDQELAEFRITEYSKGDNAPKSEPVYLKIPGKQFRKAGLGKDVTDKFLGGLPGIQKEGCDGIITSATFILHKMPAFTHTICLEFFGHDLNKSVPAIVEIIENIQKQSNVYLAGLEHLDERYIKAIKYNTKATRLDLPKMVLLGDITSDNEESLKKVVNETIKLAKKREAECFVATTSQSRKNFWADRSRTAAIAAHTNAFKVNEDVVIPLKRLIEYNEGIETINIEYSIKNKIEILESVLEYLNGPMSETGLMDMYENSDEREKIISDKKMAALKHLQQVLFRWKSSLENLEKAATLSSKFLLPEEKKNIQKGDTLKKLFLRRDIRFSYRSEVETPLKEIFAGSELSAVRKKLDKIHSDIRTGRLFVATHMHAGDGNVHTNIPVNSNDYNMMQNAHSIVVRVMALAKSLDGVISGEHGIGITKYEFMDPVDRKNFEKYKATVDPNGNFNKGKLLEGSDLSNAYTPSLRLIQQEAIILEHSELGNLNDMIKHCLRCGKCKPVCTTHVPRANLLYSPRDKILGTGMLVEAFLYEEQTRRGISLKHFDEFNDVADHCTVCHKCVTPCPVDIDFGDVTMAMKNILRTNKKKKSNPLSDLALSFLNITSPQWISIIRKFILRPAFWAQRLTHRIVKNYPVIRGRKIPASTTGNMNMKTHIVNSLKKPLPVLPSNNIRSLLDIEDSRYVSIIYNPDKCDDSSEAVFFFPGCGVERLYTDVYLAAIAMLYDMGVKVVLPPEYACCGAPQSASGDMEQSSKITFNNRVRFHRVANTLNYLEIKTVLTICGTCIDQLKNYEFEGIFPESRLMDVHEFVFEKGIKLNGKQNKEYIYHDPCHTPIKNYSPIQLTKNLMGKNVILSDRCCAESGLFAIARPDISSQSKFRKLEVLHENIERLGKFYDPQNTKVLTSCPSCLQGLTRYTTDIEMTPYYIISELADNLLGDNWKGKYLKEIKQKGIEKILL